MELFETPAKDVRKRSVQTLLNYAIKGRQYVSPYSVALENDLKEIAWLNLGYYRIVKKKIIWQIFDYAGNLFEGEK
ncbi:MAG: hypothetical protein WC549_01925 [Actinomycetota bacterium]